MACKSGTVAVADASSGTPLASLDSEHAITTPYGPNPTLYLAVLSPSGELLATSGIDNVVRVWEAETGEPRGCLAGHTGAVRGLAWADDESALASASLDGTARLWRREVWA